MDKIDKIGFWIQVADEFHRVKEGDTNRINAKWLIKSHQMTVEDFNRMKHFLYKQLYE